MSQDLLIELGTEELPPTALANLSRHFTQNTQQQLDDLGLQYTDITSFSSPRRLGILIKSLDEKQADKVVERKGPNIKAAFDADGNPTKAAEGFARSCKVEFEQLSQVETDKGTCLAFSFTQAGLDINAIIPKVIQSSLDKLPIPKRMRWGNLDVQFVRPVHWLIVLYGTQVIDCEILSVKSSNQTFGHRFHHPEAITINQPSDYEAALLKANVIANYEERKKIIVEQVNTIAKEAEGVAVIDDDLLDEVTGMVEWPQAVLGSFDDEFLEIPAEALISSMKKHQKYFHILSKKNNNKLLPAFITISNIESKDISQVREGNERVIRPRLADSSFFWNKDLKTPIQEHLDGLSKVIFQQKLGSIQDKTQRVQGLSIKIAEQLNVDVEQSKEAARLCKADLMSEMVGEFPDLQGIMGRYYSQQRGDNENVSIAIDEYYLPRFSGDRTTTNPVAQVLTIADRIDTLCGIFAIGSQPTGDKDPFALRRAALGLLRTIIENQLDIDVTTIVELAIEQYPDNLYEKTSRPNSAKQIINFIFDRFKGYLLEKNLPNDIYESVHAAGVTHLVDFIKRIDAVMSFNRMPDSDALAAANKRINNILKKVDNTKLLEIKADLFSINEEKALYETFTQITPSLDRWFSQEDYSAYLNTLVKLKNPVDQFFEKVMVFDENEDLRDNRIALLSQIHQRFTHIADISYL